MSPKFLTALLMTALVLVLAAGELQARCRGGTRFRHAGRTSCVQQSYAQPEACSAIQAGACSTCH